MKGEGVDVAEIGQEFHGWVDENATLITNKIFTLKGTWLMVHSDRMV